MTVTDSAACAARGDLHPGIWPRTARAVAGGGISVGGVPLADIAAGYGTPAYVLDEADVRQRCRGYRQAFPDAEIAYAGKAFLCRAMAHWVDEEGLSLDVCSEGELAVASSVGFPAQRIVLHGNAKTPGDLRAALAYGVGRIVVDSAGEIARIAALAQPAAHPLAGPLARPRQRVLVRVTPGVDAHAHPALATGVENQKFGFSLSTGAAADAVRRILAQPELRARRPALPPRLADRPAGGVRGGRAQAGRAHGGRPRRTRRHAARTQPRRRPWRPATPRMTRTST